ncbi:MAG: bifunctional oligoribonuclease/PAP phosphatase NrnA [Clostridia bacterium]|nr:bifunctional oligoribonuclease/PAP phosphatase NrnA [Clostridia bacterium]
MSTVEQIVCALRQTEQCTIFMHHRPDGDTVGSAAALGIALRRLGKQVQYACSDEITPRYAPLVGGEAHFDEPCGTLIAVDIAAPDMGGRFSEYVQRADIVIDHHGSNKGYGKLNLICPEAAAAGEIVYEVVKALTTVDLEIAQALYTAISTDTGCFRHGSTTANTHRVAADLMETGLDITALNRKLFSIKTRAALMMGSKLLDTLTLYNEGRVAVLFVTKSMIAECGATEDDMENIAAVGMQIEGVHTAATLRELAENEYKVSVRSDGSVNAAKICAHFGGGGHPMAAGCTLRGTLDECKEQMARVMGEEL